MNDVFSLALPVVFWYNGSRQGGTNYGKGKKAVFYPLRRGYLVNTLYIVALRRFEAELISGISIPIPALTYTQVKRDLQELIEKK